MNAWVIELEGGSIIVFDDKMNFDEYFESHFEEFL